MKFFITPEDSKVVRRLKLFYLVPFALVVWFPFYLFQAAVEILQEIAEDTREEWG